MTLVCIANRKGIDLGHRTKRNPLPTDPAECARRAYEGRVRAGQVRAVEQAREADPGQWGLSQELGKLATAHDIDAGTDVAGKITRAKRWDVFTLLRGTGCGPASERQTVLNGDHIIAVDRFQRDLAIRHMTAGASGSGRASDMPADFPLARIAAAERLHAVAEIMDVQAMKLLLDLSVPTVTRGERVNWRKVVQDVTGEYRDAMQAQEVRKACDALVEGYGVCDRVGRARAAA